MPHRHRNILVIRLSSIGDILLTTPALRALKRWDPHREVHFLLKSEYEELVRENPNVDRVIPWDPSGGLPGLIGLARRLRGGYDLVIDLHRSLRSAILRRAIGARQVLTYPKGVIRRTIMIQTGWKAITRKAPVPERYLRALSPIGAKGDERGIDLFISREVRDRVEGIMADEAAGAGLSAAHRSGTGHSIERFSYVAIAPGARWATKRWLPERFAAVADALAEIHGLVPILIGGRDEGEVFRAVREGMKSPALDFSGRLSLIETGAAIAASRLLISNDTGLMHMATAVSTPVVAIFGPTTRELGFYPYRGPHEVVEQDISCRPCHHLGGDRCPKGHHRCMTEIGAEAVIGAGERLLARHLPSIARTG